jgi:hypothetical protein
LAGGFEVDCGIKTQLRLPRVERLRRHGLPYAIDTYPGSFGPSVLELAEELSSILSYNYNYTSERPTNPDTWI